MSLIDQGTAAALRLRMWQEKVRQGEVAREMGMDPGNLSRILNGTRTVPDNFQAEFHAAINRTLQRRAEQALAGVESGTVKA